MNVRHRSKFPARAFFADLAASPTSARIETMQAATVAPAHRHRPEVFMHSAAPASSALLTRALVAHRLELLRGARQLVGPVDAEDLIQTTFERALRHIESFQPETNMLAWLRRIMSNLTVDTWRRRNRHPTTSLDRAPERCAPVPQPTEPWEELTSADVRAAAATLPPRFREVFELHHQRGLSYAEVGRRLDLPLGTVGTRLLRARLHLRKRLVAMLADGRPDVGAAPDGRRPLPAFVTQRIETRIRLSLCANDQMTGPRPPTRSASKRRPKRQALELQADVAFQPRTLRAATL
jgi:RNA polymerase sigma-70 factor (ECF subfamily)